MWKQIELDVECIVCNKTLQKISHDPHEVSFKMRKIANRRSRTPNWSLEEKQYLLDLIKERKDVVVNKSSNGPNHSEEKDAAWNEILRELTQKFGTKFNGFSIKKVKTQWQNMKRIAREEITLNGATVQHYTRQSFEVCNILDLVRDGVLKKDTDKFCEPVLNTNVEIKTECIDEEINEPSCSELNNYSIESENIENNTTMLESSDSSIFGLTDVNEMENQEEIIKNKKKNATADAMTETSNIFDINMLPKEFHDFMRYSATEKELKMEALKEERQIVRAMRETAELNKIIAEQKLKHVLWVKKQEMALVHILIAK